MITFTLDRFDFLSAVEGFACGSHLRQHVWEQIAGFHHQMEVDKSGVLNK